MTFWHRIERAFSRQEKFLANGVKGQRGMTRESGISNPVLSESVHYLTQWSMAMGKKWKELHEKVTSAGMTCSHVLTYEADDFTIKINPGVQNDDPGVIISTTGFEERIEKFVLAISFDVKLLPKIHEAVHKSLKHVEERYREKIDHLPKVIDDFGADVADLKKGNTFSGLTRG